LDSFLLQDWITISGQSSGTPITQSESNWLDLAEYDDVVFYTDVRTAQGTVLLAFQTAPCLKRVRSSRCFRHHACSNRGEIRVPTRS